jgi:hypothetical protein
MITLPEVAVMYSGLRIVRVPWAGRESLQRDDVIAVAVINDAHVRRCAVIEYDWYQLIWTDTDYCLTGHDEPYRFFNLEGRVVETRFPFVMPENSIEFEGVQVSAAEYAKAKEIFADPDGGMI